MPTNAGDKAVECKPEQPCEFAVTDVVTRRGVEPFFPSPQPTRQCIAGKAESQPVAQSDRRMRQQIRAHPKDKNAL
jgi:hypothetical protein